MLSVAKGFPDPADVCAWFGVWLPALIPREVRDGLSGHPPSLPVIVGRLAGRDQALLRSKGAMRYDQRWKFIGGPCVSPIAVIARRLRCFC